MYFKRPSFRRGGGIDELTPRVRAQSGYFGSTPIYPIPINQINASAAMPMGSGNVPMMKSFPMDATEMGVASIRSVEDSPSQSSAFGKGTKFKKQPSIINTEDEFIVVDRLSRTGGTNKVRIRNPNYIPTGKFRDIKGGKGKVFVEDKKETESSGASAVGKGTKFKKSEGIIDIEAGPAGDQITMATDEEKAARTEALLKKIEEDTKEIEPGSDKDNITLDPLEEIKKEKDFLSELLKNEGLAKGEIALIAAKAIGTEGSFKDKLDAAVSLALPVVRRRDKEDKALTLTAYKAFKEKEKATAKATADANKPTQGIREIRFKAEQLLKSGDKSRGSTVDEIVTSLIKDKIQSPDAAERINQLGKAQKEIFESFDDLKDAKKNLDLYIKKKGDKLKEDDKRLVALKQELADKLAVFKIFYDVPEFKNQYGSYVTQFEALGLRDGGRVKRALGSPSTGEQIVTTEAETIGAETAERPVLKLTYGELRNRLPQEITDDVVQLLANSEEALQDFAYIQTQNDVDAFNLKYGVNLTIPPAPQTA